MKDEVLTNKYLTIADFSELSEIALFDLDDARRKRDAEAEKKCLAFIENLLRVYLPKVKA